MPIHMQIIAWRLWYDMKKACPRKHLLQAPSWHEASPEADLWQLGWQQRSFSCYQDTIRAQYEDEQAGSTRQHWGKSLPTILSRCQDARYKDILFVRTTKLGISHGILTVMVLVTKDNWCKDSFCGNQCSPYKEKLQCCNISRLYPCMFAQHNCQVFSSSACQGWHFWHFDLMADLLA